MLHLFRKTQSNDNNGYDTEGSSCTLEELNTNLNKCFESKEFTDALNGLKRKMEPSIHSLEFDVNDNKGFDVEPNNYTLEQLSKDITKTQQSKEFKTLMNVLKQRIIETQPHKIKL